jgi:hypothetical protein
MPYKNGRYIRSGRMSCIPELPKAEIIQENSEKRMLEKVQEFKKEESQSEDQKKERLKKFVSFKIK